VQRQSDACLRRFLRAFSTADDAFIMLVKCIKWRREFGVDSLSESDADIKLERDTGKAQLLRHRDFYGRSLGSKQAHHMTHMLFQIIIVVCHLTLCLCVLIIVVVLFLLGLLEYSCLKGSNAKKTFKRSFAAMFLTLSFCVILWQLMAVKIYQISTLGRLTDAVYKCLFLPFLDWHCVSKMT